ncbi:uncharacterized protein LOC119585418 [Penaeus monodon]|uniref:uncharacterized protein LOC119585418 n=1 Tax=Penaeus monodon TaxID=6687 RepID=UPI0018A740B4|nr:uncharacterized protein LOC119585418 [Penaeus monodon]
MGLLKAQGVTSQTVACATLVKITSSRELCPTAPDRCIPSGCMDYSRLVFPTRTCGLGMAKCLDMNICVIPCPPNSALHNPSSALMPALCVDGKMYCPNTGTCGTQEECTMGKPGETPICNFGYQYCLIMGGCVPKGGCPDDDAFMTSELTTCPHGQDILRSSTDCVVSHHSTSLIPQLITPYIFTSRTITAM